MIYSPTKTSRQKRLVAATALAGLAVLFAAPAFAKAPAPAMDASDSSLSATQESDLRLELDKVDLAIESGKLSQAEDMVEKLKAKYPNNPDVLAAERDITDQRAESSNGATAFNDSCAPSSLDPNSLDLLRRDRPTNTSFACVGYNRRITQQSLEQISSITGQQAVPLPGVAVSYDLEHDHTNTFEPFTHLDRTEQSFYGDRMQGTVMVEKSFQNKDQAALSVYGNDDTAGVGAQYVLHDRWGGTAIQGAYNQPDWDYVEMIVQNGTKDNIHIERKQVFSENFQAVLSAGYSHYSLDGGDHGLADAPGWNFGLDYLHPIKLNDQGANSDAWYGDEITLGAHYGVEAEYFTYVNHRLDLDSDPFHPLPATSYEVHSFTVSAGKSLWNNVDAEIEGGYGVNRWTGGSGPVYGGSLTYTPFQHFGIDIHGSRTLLGGQNNGGKEDITGASLKLVW